MKKFISILPIFLVLIVGILMAQHSIKIDFKKSWEKVNELADKQLPESALKEVVAIQRQAEKDNNSPEMIKALIYKMRFTLEIDPDKAPELIGEFEKFTQKSTNTTEKALLLSMTAELYTKYYQSDMWNINQRTQTKGYVPDDINEWTKNIYFDKIIALFSASLEQKAMLQTTDVSKYKDLLTEGEDSHDLQPTLYDFLLYRKIDILTSIYSSNKPDLQVQKEITNSFDSLIALRKSGENIPATVYAELKYLNFIHVQSNTWKNDLPYLTALNDLEKNYANNEAVVEILAEKANYYLNNANSELDKNDDFKKIANDICIEGIKKYPTYKRIDLLKNIQKQIEQKTLYVAHKDVSTPQSNLELNIRFKNIRTINIRVYRLNATALEFLAFQEYGRKVNGNYPNKTLQFSKEIALATDMKFNAKDTVISIETGDYGIYEVDATENGMGKEAEMTSSFYVVTDLAAINKSNDEKNQSWYVLDRTTGAQQSKVKVNVYEKKWMDNAYGLNFVNKYITNRKGYFSVDFKTNYNQMYYSFERGEDKYYSPNSSAYFSGNRKNVVDKAGISIFTDRSLYRPGQIVHFKGIAYYSTKDRNEIIKNKSFEVKLYDANNQIISSKTFTSNDFGSFAGEFVLPQSGLNGAYRISVENSSQTVWVEEYKRPTFEVKIEKPKTEVRFGEEVTLSGNVKAFAGYNVAQARVNYRVVRATYRFCWWNNEPETELLNGTAITDADGNFSFSFVPEKTQESDNTWRGQFYSYKLYADVTDTKGETQQGENMFTVGDKSLFIIANVPAKIEKNTTTPINIVVQTLNEEVLTQEVAFELYKLNDFSGFAEDLKADYVPTSSKKVLDGKFNTADKNLMLAFNKFDSGQYKLIFRTQDARGNEVKSEHIFTVYGENDRRPAVKSYVWLLQKEVDCAVGEKATVRFGSSADNAKVLVELMLGNKALESNWVTINNKIRTFKVAFKDSYGAGVRLRFTFVKNEKFFTEEVLIKRKVEAKKITPTLSVFRNKLQPGEKAEWTITVPELKNSAKLAEVLAAMYDASLDKIRPHNWSFNPVYQESVLTSTSWNSTLNDSKTASSMSVDLPLSQLDSYKLNSLNWFGLEFGRENIGVLMRVRGTSPTTITNEDMKNASVAVVDDALQGKVDGVAVYGLAVQKAGTAMSAEVNAEDVAFQIREAPKEKPVQLRSNFNETAFFYPQLRTDAEGDVKFSFTVPESLTRWKLMMLAHTQDLYSGQNEVEVVTQKDLMVQMNLPRFVRRSDKLTLTANVINLSDKDLKADVQFELIDPATDKVIYTATAAPLALGKGAGVVSFDVSNFSSYDLVVCKIVARAGNFSDGEQKYLPVLPDKVLITESMPLIVRANESKTFSFESLIKNASKVETQNLSLEFSSNPAWYAVQALPTLSAPENENALDYFTAYYANSLAAFIANSNPKLATTFDRWRKSGGSRDALLSNLEKNSELKNMLLDETPWLMAAKDETEQKRQIALLFDLNLQKNQGQQYLAKLLKLQATNGGFAWFEGMPESRYVTQEVMLNLGRLSKLTNSNLLTDYRTQFASALTYLDTEIAKDFVQLKKNNKNYEKENCIGNMQLFYLHTRSEFSEIPIDTNAKEAVEFYTAQSEKYWTSFTLYGKAMMAVVAQRKGNTQLANNILKSLKENALKTDELGMYWARNTSGYFWNERPVAVQAAIIEAFAEISKNQSDIDEMKIWLLKQKQTQRWDSPMSSVNAIYALLMQGSNWLSNEGTVEIKVGNKIIQPKTTEAGTGFFKQSLDVQNVNAEMGKVTVSTIDGVSSLDGVTSNNPVTKNAGIGWGAMYWQYYQELDKVKSQSGALKISKKLFVVRAIADSATPNGTVSGNTSMIPIEQTTLKKGDKVITRLVVTTDRNLEYVALKDLRAACFEPVNQHSGCEWKEGVCYYQTTKDASTQFFFSYLPKGTNVFEYEMWANNSGTFTSGIVSVQCQYAPEFVSHTGGEKIKVE